MTPYDGNMAPVEIESLKEKIIDARREGWHLVKMMLFPL